MNKLEPGSYMTGTTLDRDLIGMFRTIAFITGDSGLEHDVNRASEYLDLVEWYEVRADTESDPCTCSQCMRPYQNANAHVEDYIQDFFDYVDENLTPEGFHFGAHEGDGADYGVWPDEPEYEDDWDTLEVSFNLFIDPNVQNQHTTALILKAVMTRVVMDYNGIEGWKGITTKEVT